MDSTVTTDVTKVVESLPVVIEAINQVSSDLDNSHHQTILQTTASLLDTAANSAKTLGDQGLIGHNDADNVENSVSIVEEFASLAERLKVLITHIF